MAGYKGSRSNRRNNAYTDLDQQIYVYGNTVRKSEAVPRRREEAIPEQPKKPASRQVRKNRKKALHMSAGYVLFLAAAAVVGLVVCISFLQLRSEVTVRSKNINALQQELSSLKEENTTKYNSVMDSVNLEEIRDRAVNELGMVYAAEGQVIEYKNPSNDYVKQYEEIPESGVLAASRKASE